MRRRASVAWLLICAVALLLTSFAFAGEEAPPAPAPAPGVTAPPETAPAPAAPAPEAAPQPAAPAPVVPPTVPPVITSIEVVGNQVVPTGDITAAITSKVGEAYSEQQVEQDREAVSALGLFSRVTVDREVTESGIRLVFHVVENPVISSIQFEGVTVFKPEQLLAIMKTKPGTVFNSNLARQDLETIQNFYTSHGYSLALVLSPRVTNENVLAIPVLEGQIEEVRITGNTRTKESIIRHMIRVKPGDIYNSGRVQADINRLFASDLFESVVPRALPGTAPGKVILVYEVVEKRRTGEATVGFGYSSVQKLVGYINVTKSNLGGTAQSVTVRTEFGGRDSYELYYGNPFIFGNTRLNAGVYDKLIVREAFLTDESGESSRHLYDERRVGGSVTFAHPLTDFTTAYLSLRADRVSVTNLTEEEQQLLSSSAFQERDVRSITTGFIADYRDIPRAPTRGAYHQVAAEFAGLLGGSTFNRYSGDERHYLPVAKAGKGVIASRLLLGTITGNPPFLEQFLLGGSESLRGYRNDRFVGTHMAVLNTEYRRRLTENLTGVLFVDIGDAWGGPTVEATPIQGDVSFRAHAGYGFGIRVATPIGPLRLDIGFSPEGTETHFGLGQVF